MQQITQSVDELEPTDSILTDINTTLYDLFEAVNGELGPEEDRLVTE